MLCQFADRSINHSEYQSGYFASNFPYGYGYFPTLCTYVMGLPAIGYPPEEMVLFLHYKPRVRGLVNEGMVATRMYDSYG